MKKAADTTPNHGRVIIKVAPTPTSTIMNPDKEKEKPQEGEVVAIGHRLPGVLPFVEMGDTVKFGKYAGIMCNYTDGEHLVMMESDIIDKD